jgi:hypothetical protein
MGILTWLKRETKGIKEAQTKHWENKRKKLKETKCTCQSCGNVWYFGKTDQLQNVGNAMQNLGKSMSCCTGCAPALLIKNKEVKDLKKCPKCNSKNVICENIIHEIK